MATTDRMGKKRIAENRIKEIGRASFATDCNPGASEHRMSSIKLAFLKPVSEHRDDYPSKRRGGQAS
jgi:hypothetical protein